MLTNIFCDLDNTLLDFDGGEAHALSRALRQFGVDPTPAVLDRYHAINLSQWELLEALAPRYSLYLATNGAAAVQRRRLADAGILPYFQNIFISEEVGFHKPSPAFFHACFAAIPGFDPASALMVGDSLTSDIRGGRDAGLRTCWLDRLGRSRRPDLLPDYTVTALNQLPALLETL